MTPAQTKLYWREWAAVRKADKDADRHALHRQALGREVSSKAFTNRQLDAVLGVFRSVSRPADVGAQLRQEDQERSRQLFLIKLQLRCVALYRDPEAYLARVIKGKFRGATSLDDLGDKPRVRCLPGTTDLQEGDSDLMMLRYTLAARLNDLRNEAGDTIHGMKAKAGVRCDCAVCSKARREGVDEASIAQRGDADESGVATVPAVAEGEPF